MLSLKTCFKGYQKASLFKKKAFEFTFLNTANNHTLFKRMMNPKQLF